MNDLFSTAYDCGRKSIFCFSLTMVGHHLFVFNCFEEIWLSMILSILIYLYIYIDRYLFSKQNVFVYIDMYKCYTCLIYSNDNMYYTNDDMIPKPEPATTNSTFPLAL